MSKLYVRIDDRLIHGQIVTAWTKSLGIQRILAIDDVMSKNPMMKSIMTMGVAKHIEANIIALDEVQEYLEDMSKTTLLIIRFCKDLKELSQFITHAEHINIGNCSKQANATLTYRGIGVGQIISLTQDDIEALDLCGNLGITIISQQIPTERQITWDEIKKQ